MVSQLSRYEFKYIYDSIDLMKVHYEILNAPFVFKEVYETRLISNIYFDSINRFSYEENLGGVNTREKYRVRWYSPKLFPTRLEIKKKNGDLGFKEYHLVNDTSIVDFDWEIYKKHIKSHMKKLKMDQIVLMEWFNRMPVLYNQYRRKYYESACKRFRFTIDYDLAYREIINGRISKAFHREDLIVLELKFDEQYYELSKIITESLSKRLSSNSKFVNGVKCFV